MVFANDTMAEQSIILYYHNVPHRISTSKSSDENDMRFFQKFPSVAQRRDDRGHSSR